mgnify:CR=1 FL=1
MTKIIPDRELDKFIKSSGWKPENRSENDNGDINMPTISISYGIIIYMYYFDNKEHKMPHIHANYAEYDAVISIPQGKVLNGEMPNKKLKLIQAWVEIHQENLMANWKLAVEGQQPHKIEPLR